MALDSVGHNLLHALQWELHDFKVTNTQQRWDLDQGETAAVEKWISARIEELATLRGY